MYKKRMDLDAVKTFIDNQPEGTRIYIGADSERLSVDGVFYADYALCIVVHIGGRYGCKVFGEISRERDFDQKASRPAMRLMNEVFKVAELFQKLQEVLVDKNVEVHLDINPDECATSSIVIQQAIGYIRGTCNTMPKVKPQAFAASYCADRLKTLMPFIN